MGDRRNELRLLCVSAEEHALFHAAAKRRDCSSVARWIRGLVEQSRRYPLLQTERAARARYVPRPKRLAFCVSEAERLDQARHALELRTTWPVWLRSLLLRDCASLGLATKEEPTPPPVPQSRRTDRVFKTIRF